MRLIANGYKRKRLALGSGKEKAHKPFDVLTHVVVLLESVGTIDTALYTLNIETNTLALA
jgi:hypothetical protein